jgi:hypothetical protein
VKYIRRRCLQGVNLLKSVAGVLWGAHPSCLILLYKELIGLVLEYGSVCFMNMAKTHMLALGSVQYPSLRIALGLMGSTPNNCLGGLGGIPPLDERFAYLNFRYLRERLGVLGALNMRRCVRVSI